MPDRPPVVAPVWHLRRAAELCLPAEAREAFVAECIEAAEVVGDTYTMPRERFEAIRAKWKPRNRCHQPSPPASHPSESAYPHGLGTLTRRGIDLVSLGMAKPLAMAVAKVMGAKNCGCEGRERCLNMLVPDVAKVGGLEWVKLAPRIFACLGVKNETV